MLLQQIYRLTLLKVLDLICFHFTKGEFSDRVMDVRNTFDNLLDSMIEKLKKGKDAIYFIHIRILQTIQ